MPIIIWAEEVGVRRFFPSEYGGYLSTLSEYDTWSSLDRAKMEVRTYIEARTGIEYTTLTTGPISDMYLDSLEEAPKEVGFNVHDGVAYLLGCGNLSLSFTALSDVGKFVVAALISHISSRNVMLKVHSFIATPDEIVTEFEAQTTGAWQKHHVDLTTMKKLEREAHQIHSPLATLLTVVRGRNEGVLPPDFYDNSLLGFVETEILEDQVRYSIAKQTHEVPRGIEFLRTLSAL